MAVIRARAALVHLVSLMALAACAGSGSMTATVGPAPTRPAVPTQRAVPSAAAATPAAVPAGFTVQVDVARNAQPISPLVYGVSDGSVEVLDSLRPALISWGGNPSTRYNWRLGNAWNSGRDYEYRNRHYDFTGASASDSFVAAAAARGIAVRLAVPTLGWVAKDGDFVNCSFPLADGGCGDAGGADCSQPGPVADPSLTSVASDVSSVTAWMQHLQDTQGNAVQIVAMDNEPELWGFTHYDVHPTCTTYTEILERYLTYATAVRGVAPQAELAGPITCCWYFYWNSAAGEADKALHNNADFLPWFLDQVRQHDEAAGQRTLDVLDVHYYPEGVYRNEATDPATAALRLRSTRALWDAAYVDESWIGEPVALIPRMRRLIEARYPGTRFGLSEWNWGADETLNGALAVADVLGILGREQVYYAAYWRVPPPGSPAFEAFRLYTNFDGHGGRFGDLSVWAQPADVDVLGSYAALDTNAGSLHVMLVHKQPDAPLTVRLDLRGFTPQPVVQQYRLAGAETAAIAASTIGWDPQQPTLELPPYSVTLLVFAPQSGAGE